MNYLRLTLGEFLDEVAAGQPAPGAGSVAAVTVAMAAGLVAMSARLSAEALRGTAARAEEIHRAIAPLAQADAEGYARVLEANRLPRDDPERAAALCEAQAVACEVPLAVARHAAEIAALAADLGERGNPRLRGEAVAAGLLAEAGARVTGALVQLNLAVRDDPRIVEAARLTGEAGRHVTRLLGAS